MGAVKIPSDPARAVATLRAALDTVSSRDAGRLRARLAKLGRALDADAVAAVARAIEVSAAKRAARVAAKPELHLDEALPITARADDLIDLIRRHQVVIVAGETGSGKTTQLPKLCLAAGRGEAGMIGCTQPRRLAARAVARRVAEELGTEVGGKVGFQVRFTEQVGAATLVKFMTDGILLAETQSDPWLAAYDTLIIDEAHERSLNIDFLLGYLKRLLPKRPDLKLIVTSATIDTARFARHFDDAPVVTVEGRAHPVEVRWRPAELAGEGRVAQGSAEHMALVLDEVTREDPRGDVLVFLPGEREIRDAHRILTARKYRHTEIVPLYARLSAAEQDRVFHPGPQRRVVLATNVAETSLTVPRIRCVIDTGNARVKRYSQRSQIERLYVEPVSQAAADQRKGRCGRVGPGVCWRLYGEADFAARAPFTDPELLRSSLANVILHMLALRLGDVADFPFLDAPDARAVADGYRRLAEISAIDEGKRLTATGRELARWPIDVQLARMLQEAAPRGVLADVLPLVAFLSIQDPRERPADARQQADQAHAAFADAKSDFAGILKLWQAYAAAHDELTQSKLRDWCSRHFLSFLRMREWRELHRQLLLVARDTGLAKDAATMPSSAAAASVRTRGQAAPRGRRLEHDRRAVAPLAAGAQGIAETSAADDARRYEAIHRSLLSGLPTQVARKDDRGIFRGPRERRFQVFPGSALAKAPPNWLFAAQLLDVGGKVWGLLCARVEPAWIEQQAAHLLRATCRDVHWDRRRGHVAASEHVSLFGLMLVEGRRVTFHRQDLTLAHATFVKEGLARCEVDGKADFLAANARVLAEARQRETQQRRQGLVKDDDALAAFFTGKLPEDISDSRALDAWYRKAAPAAQAALRWSLADVCEADDAGGADAFPPALAWDGQHYRLEYRYVPGDAADGVTVRVPLARLNAFPAHRGEWLVPGLLAAKAAELIRGLPKALRRNFVPAPDFARAFVAATPVADVPLGAALTAFLVRTTGVDFTADAFDAVVLPPHLQLRYELRGDDDKVLAAGRDLAALRATWQGRAHAAFSRKTDAELAREDVRHWDFDTLPVCVRTRGGLEAWPALVDLGSAVALRVFERSEVAAAEHPRGVARLLRQTLAPDFKRARRQLPIGRDVALKYTPLGGVDSLRDDLVEGGFADLTTSHLLDVRDRAAFDALAGTLRGALFAAAMRRLQLAEPIIEAQADLKPWLEPPLLGFARANYDDLREQLANLLQPGFLRDLPASRLAEYPRYLKAMRLRAERLRQDPARDQQRLLQALPYWREYLTLPPSAAREAFRWLIEEWRVSLFAQELGTRDKVSAKRLLQARDAARAAARSD